MSNLKPVKLFPITQKIAEASKKKESKKRGLKLTDDKNSSKALAEYIQQAFGIRVKYGNSSNFVGTGIEVMNTMHLGENGHIAVKTNRIEKAIYYFERKGFQVNPETAKYKDGRMTVSICLRSLVDLRFICCRNKGGLK